MRTNSRLSDLPLSCTFQALNPHGYTYQKTRTKRCVCPESIPSAYQETLWRLLRAVGAAEGSCNVEVGQQAERHCLPPIERCHIRRATLILVCVEAAMEV